METMEKPSFYSYILELAKIIALAILIVIPVRCFIFQPFVVNGSSMMPSFHNGDYVIVDEISYRFSNPQRGDVIVFHFPKNPSERFIKRVIGLPNEKVKINGSKIIITKKSGEKIVLDEKYIPKTIYLGNEEVNLAKDEYFVLGDNRAFSYDSRRWGLLKRKQIIGKVLFRIWPATAMAYIETPNY
ncbi:signal peptidase I [bacterium]|nr:signal peptidase I [bacterium]